MSFQAYLLAITYIMASIGLFASLLVEEIKAPFIILVALVAISSLAFNLRKKKPLPSFVWSISAAAVLVFFVLDYSSSSSGLIVSASRFLAILLALKLFDLNKDRDFLIAYGIVFFQVLAAAGSTVSPVFFLLLFLFIAGSIWGMIIYNLKRDRLEAAPESKGLPGDFFGAPFFVSVLITSAISLLITFGLFFILPRMGIGFLEKKTLNTVKVSGFSDKVDIGALGPVKKDSTVVMRIETRDGERNLPYLRGMALDHYDGRSWTRTVKDSALIRKTGGVFRTGNPGGRLMEQNIVLEPLETEALFTAGYPVMVEGGFNDIWLDRAKTIRLASPPYSRIEYRAWTTAYGPGEDDGPGERHLDTGFMDRGLREKIFTLLPEIIKNETTGADKADSIESWLKANYRYTLDPASGGGGPPLEDFLFTSKEGYCEHYATAMAVLLRSAGIPSRIITGFLPGEWNSYGNYYIVRQQDAHSWVEAYIDGQWVAYDPTPAAGLSPYYRPSSISLYLDYLRLRWNRYVVHFSSSDQRRAALAVENAAGKVALGFRSGSILKNIGARPLYFMVIAVAVFILALAFRALRGSKRQKTRTPPYYRDMERILVGKGFSRARGETPLEFAQRVNIRAAMEITLIFQGERYGGGHLSERDAEKVGSALERLKRHSR